MQREDLIHKIESYQPLLEEGLVKNQMIDFVKQYPQCFDRDFEVGHITGSAWLIDPTGEKVLLTHHKKLDMWMQLGGHSDGDPNTLNVALREAQEESGIEDVEFVSTEIFDMDIHDIPARRDESAHKHYDIRFLLKAAHEDYVVSDESNDLRWFTKSEVKELNLEDSVQRMIRKWMKL